MIDFRSIRHVVAVASYPTVQAAADALCLTQPALTKSIARLEAQLGAKLFDRSARKLVLTELGERLVARGDVLLRNVREMEEEVELWNNLGTGEVVVGVDPETELELLSPVLEKFVPAHPQVQVTVRSGYAETLLPSLISGDLHILIADPEMASEHNDLTVHLLAKDSIVAAVQPDHPLADSTSIEPDDFVQYPIAGASTAPRFIQWKFERGKESIGRAFIPSLLCDNYEVLVRLAESSNTIAFGPKKLFTRYEQQGRVKVMPWELGGPAIQAGIIRSRDRFLSPAATKLIELFENC